jgi:SAM-dependent methyltransferase
LKPYTIFPLVYDHLLKHVDYEQWYRYIRSLMFMYVDKPVKILELGCGTGKFGAKFSRDNFQIFGMDNSIEMLKMAGHRAHKNFSIFCADMQNFKLAKKFDFIFSVHDTINYFLNPFDILNVLESVRAVMDSNSIFMFDITTEYNIKKYFYNNKTDYFYNGMKVEWKNKYDTKKKLIHSFLKFKKDGNTETEEHVQKIHSPDEIKDLLEKSGFKLLDIFSDYTFEPVKEDTVMMNFVTKIKD